MQNIKDNKIICERYPFLIPRDFSTDEIVDGYDYSWILGEELPKGWQPLFYQMCDDIRQPLIDDKCLDKFRFVEIKEKYNTMRCYSYGAPEKVLNILYKYEYVSQFICQECGKPATAYTNGWITSYCDICLPKRQKQYTTPINLNLIMHIVGYRNGKKYDEQIDCSDIWERLYKENKK